RTYPGGSYAGKLSRCNPNNPHRNAVQPNCSSNRRGIATEGALPVAVSQHGDRRRAERIVGRTERSPDSGSDAQRVKKISGNHFALHKSGWAIASQVESNVSAQPCHAG